MPRRFTLLFAEIGQLVIAASACLAQGIDWTTRPGTVGHALGLPDGTRVYLDAVDVDKIRAGKAPAYFTIKEPFSQADRLVVLTPPSLSLRLGQSLDIEGTLTTLDNGSRALVDVTVLGYTESDGTLIRGGTIIKGLLEPTEWQWMVDLTVSEQTLSRSSMIFWLGSYLSDGPNTDSDILPQFFSSISEIIASTEPASLLRKTPSMSMQTITDFSELDDALDGDLVELQCKSITDAGTEEGTLYNYLVVADDSPDTGSILAYCART